MADYTIPRQSDVLLENWFNKQSDPLPPWMRQGTKSPVTGVLSAAPERPSDWAVSSGLAETLSPIAQGYGAGQMAGDAYQAAKAGDYGSATGGGLLAAMSMLPMKKGAPVAAAEKPSGIRAYHGSPHDFDKFDMSKIGTGEGAQAYGHGLYFAENEGVAKQYRDNLSNLVPANVPTPLPGKIVNGRYQYAPWTPEEQAALDAVKTPPGRMYEVNINADPSHFLDWDKPLSQQSEKVRNSIAQAGLEPWHAVDVAGTKYGPMPKQDALAISRGKRPAGPSEDAYGHHVMELFGGIGLGKAKPEISNALREAGIPGIRYLDQGSRGSGEGSRNYVVFDPATIEILRKYGILGPMAGGVAAGAMQQPGILGDQ